MHASRRRTLIPELFWPRFGLLVVLLVVLALAGVAAVSMVRSPQVRAAGSDPIIHWDSNMIYPGQNNGYPWGPVGEMARVHGEKFTASAVLGLPVTLALIKGDVNNPPGGGSSYEFCKLAGPKIALPGHAQVDNSGNFDYNFTWPAAAGSGMYSICAYNTVDGLPAGNIDDGPFTVLAGSAPSVAVSRSTVATGETITVTGENWVPPQPVNVYVGACVDCDGPVVVAGTANSSGLNTGTFSITFTIPDSATPGNYVAGANAQNGGLDVGPTGARHVTINAAAPPTAVPTPTEPPTVAPTLATGSGATGSGSAGNSGSDGSNSVLSTPVVFILMAVGGLLLLVGLVIALLVALSRRRARKMPPGAWGANAPGPGWGSPGPAAGYGADAGADAVAPNGASVQQNWQTLAPGWGEQTPPTAAPVAPVLPGMAQGDDTPTRANLSQQVDPAAYPPAPPAAYPPGGGDTPTQPGAYHDTPPPLPYNP